MDEREIFMIVSRVSGVYAVSIAKGHGGAFVIILSACSD